MKSSNDPEARTATSSSDSFLPRVGETFATGNPHLMPKQEPCLDLSYLLLEAPAPDWPCQLSEDEKNLAWADITIKQVMNDADRRFPLVTWPEKLEATEKWICFMCEQHNTAEDAHCGGCKSRATEDAELQAGSLLQYGTFLDKDGNVCDDSDLEFPFRWPDGCEVLPCPEDDRMGMDSCPSAEPSPRRSPSQSEADYDEDEDELICNDDSCNVKVLPGLFGYHC